MRHVIIYAFVETELFCRIQKAASSKCGLDSAEPTVLSTPKPAPLIGLTLQLCVSKHSNLTPEKSFLFPPPFHDKKTFFLAFCWRVLLGDKRALGQPPSGEGDYHLAHD